MKSHAYIALTLLLIVNSILINGRKTIVKTVKNCDANKNYAAKLNFTVRTIDTKQYLDGRLTLTEPLDNTVRSNISVEMLTGKNYVYLFSINERKSCEAAHKYLGEFIYDMERHAQIIPRTCPLAKGKYNLHNFPMDYEKVPTLVNFPFGNLRFIGFVYDKKNNLYTCIVLEVEHRM